MVNYTEVNSVSFSKRPYKE